MATKNEAMDPPEHPSAGTGQLDTADLEAVVGGNDPNPLTDVDQAVPVQVPDPDPGVPDLDPG